MFPDNLTWPILFKIHQQDDLNRGRNEQQQYSGRRNGTKNILSGGVIRRRGSLTYQILNLLDTLAYPTLNYLISNRQALN
jgi:hypothetical protein